MASRNPARPLSPHLQVYKWGPHMLVSILHRATGSGMATVGSLLLVWWLAAIASGDQAYATFVDVFTRDTGAGYELKRNKAGAIATMVASVALTVVFWLYMGIK